MSCPLCNRWQTEPELRIAELQHCFVMLNRDQFFPGYSLVISKQHVTELFHLERGACREMLEEVVRVAAALDRVYRPDKMNYELLGNMVPHIHWHLVPRFSADPLWPRPIWSEPHQEKDLPPEEYRQTVTRIRAALGPPPLRHSVPFL